MDQVVEAPLPALLAGEGAYDDALAGKGATNVFLRALAVVGHGLVVGEPAAELDPGAVQRAHALDVCPVERQIAEIAVQNEDRLVVRIDESLENPSVGRHVTPPLPPEP